MEVYETIAILYRWEYMTTILVIIEALAVTSTWQAFKKTHRNGTPFSRPLPMVSGQVANTDQHYFEVCLRCITL